MEVLLAACMWGCTGVFAKWLAALGIAPLQVVCLRTGVAALTVTLFLWIRKQWDVFRVCWKDLWIFLGTGIGSLLLMNFFYFTAIELVGLSVAVVLMYTAPIFIMLFSVVLFGEKFTLQKGMALGLTTAGCVLVSGVLAGGGTFSWAGIGMGVASGLTHALYSVFGRFALQRGYSSLTVSLYTFWFAALGSLPFLGDGWKVFVSLESSLPALGIGILCCVLPYGLYTIGLQKMENSKAAILNSVEPLVASLWGIFLFREPGNLTKILGMVCILGGTFISAERSKKRD